MADRDLENISDSEHLEDPAAWLAELQKVITRPEEALANNDPATATRGADDSAVEITAETEAEAATDQTVNLPDSALVLDPHESRDDEPHAEELPAEERQLDTEEELFEAPAEEFPAEERQLDTEEELFEAPAEESPAEEHQIDTATDLFEPQADERQIDAEAEWVEPRADELPGEAPRADELPSEDARIDTEEELFEAPAEESPAEEHQIDSEAELFEPLADGLAAEASRADELPADDARTATADAADAFTEEASALPFTLFTPAELAHEPEEPAFDPLPIAETAEPTLEQVMATIEQETAAFHEDSRVLGTTYESRRLARWAETDWRHIVFTLADTRYAMKIGHVIEIAHVPAITWVPNVPSWIRGVSNLRGEVLTILDFRMFLGLEPLPREDTGKLLVVRGSGEEATAGLVVDSVNGAATVDPSRLRAPTAPLQNRVMPFLDGVCEEHDRLLAVFDLERILAAPELQPFQIA